VAGAYSSQRVDTGKVTGMQQKLGSEVQEELQLEEVRQDIMALVEKLDRIIAEGESKEG
jgi:hypothetical protein